MTLTYKETLLALAINRLDLVCNSGDVSISLLLNMKTPLGNTLHWCAYFGADNILKVLSSDELQKLTTHENEKTPLMLAVGGGHFSMARELQKIEKVLGVLEGSCITDTVEFDNTISYHITRKTGIEKLKKEIKDASEAAKIIKQEVLKIEGTGWMIPGELKQLNTKKTTVSQHYTDVNGAIDVLVKIIEKSDDEKVQQDLKILKEYNDEQMALKLQIVEFFQNYLQDVLKMHAQTKAPTLEALSESSEQSFANLETAQVEASSSPVQKAKYYTQFISWPFFKSAEEKQIEAQVKQIEVAISAAQRAIAFYEKIKGLPPISSINEAIDGVEGKLRELKKKLSDIERKQEHTKQALQVVSNNAIKDLESKEKKMQLLHALLIALDYDRHHVDRYNSENISEVIQGLSRQYGSSLPLELQIFLLGEQLPTRAKNFFQFIYVYNRQPQLLERYNGTNADQVCKESYVKVVGTDISRYAVGGPLKRDVNYKGVLGQVNPQKANDFLHRSRGHLEALFHLKLEVGADNFTTLSYDELRAFNPSSEHFTKESLVVRAMRYHDLQNLSLAQTQTDALLKLAIKFGNVPLIKYFIKEYPHRFEKIGEWVSSEELNVLPLSVLAELREIINVPLFRYVVDNIIYSKDIITTDTYDSPLFLRQKATEYHRMPEMLNFSPDAQKLLEYYITGVFPPSNRFNFVMYQLAASLLSDKADAFLVKNTQGNRKQSPVLSMNMLYLFLARAQILYRGKDDLSLQLFRAIYLLHMREYKNALKILEQLSFRQHPYQQYYYLIGLCSVSDNPIPISGSLALLTQLNTHPYLKHLDDIEHSLRLKVLHTLRDNSLNEEVLATLAAERLHYKTTSSLVKTNSTSGVRVRGHQLDGFLEVDMPTPTSETVFLEVKKMPSKRVYINYGSGSHFNSFTNILMAYALVRQLTYSSSPLIPPPIICFGEDDPRGTPIFLITEHLCNAIPLALFLEHFPQEKVNEETLKIAIFISRIMPIFDRVDAWSVYNTEGEFHLIWQPAKEWLQMLYGYESADLSQKISKVWEELVTLYFINLNVLTVTLESLQLPSLPFNDDFIAAVYKKINTLNKEINPDKSNNLSITDRSKRWVDVSTLGTESISSLYSPDNSPSCLELLLRTRKKELCLEDVSAKQIPHLLVFGVEKVSFNLRLVPTPEEMYYLAGLVSEYGSDNFKLIYRRRIVDITFETKAPCKAVIGERFIATAILQSKTSLSNSEKSYLASLKAEYDLGNFEGESDIDLITIASPIVDLSPNGEMIVDMPFTIDSPIVALSPTKYPQSDSVDTTIISGWTLRDVPGDGNCFYYAIADQLGTHPECPESTELHTWLRFKVEGENFNDTNWASDQNIFAMSSELDMVIAVIHTNKIDEGYNIYYKAAGTEIPQDKKVLRLAFTEQHFLSVLFNPALKEGLLKEEFDKSKEKITAQDVSRAPLEEDINAVVERIVDTDSDVLAGNYINKSVLEPLKRESADTMAALFEIAWVKKVPLAEEGYRVVIIDSDADGKHTYPSGVEVVYLARQGDTASCVDNALYTAIKAKTLKYKAYLFEQDEHLVTVVHYPLAQDLEMLLPRIEAAEIPEDPVMWRRYTELMIGKKPSVLYLSNSNKAISQDFFKLLEDIKNSGDFKEVIARTVVLIEKINSRDDTVEFQDLLEVLVDIQTQAISYQDYTSIVTNVTEAIDGSWSKNFVTSSIEHLLTTLEEYSPSSELMFQHMQGLYSYYTALLAQLEIDYHFDNSGNYYPFPHGDGPDDWGNGDNALPSSDSMTIASSSNQTNSSWDISLLSNFSAYL